MDLEEAKKFCQTGIAKGFFGVDAVRDSLATLRQRMISDPDASIQGILVEKGHLKPSQAMDILREMVSDVSFSSPRARPASPVPPPEPEREPEPEPEPEPAAPVAQEAPASYSEFESAFGDPDMTLDAEALSESMEMFALSEEVETSPRLIPEPEDEEPPPIEELALPEADPEPEPPAPESPPEFIPPPEEDSSGGELESGGEFPPLVDVEPEAPGAFEPPPDLAPCPPVEPEPPAEAEPVPEPEPEAFPASTEEEPTVPTPESRDTVPGSAEAAAAAGMAKETIGRATQGSLLSADDFFRCLNMSFQKEKFLYAAGTFVLIAVVGAILTQLGEKSGSDLWRQVSRGLAAVFAIVAFLAVTGVIARSAHREIDGGAPLGPREALSYLKTNFLSLLASPAIFLVGLGVVTLLSVGLFYLLGLIGYVGPLIFGLATLVVFAILLSAFVLGFLGLLVIPAAVAVEEKNPIETVKTLWVRVRARPVPLLFTEVLAFLFISIVTFALATVVAIPFQITNQLESRVQETEAVYFPFQTPASVAVAGMADAGTAPGETEEKGGFETFCFWIGEVLYRLSMYVIVAAVLTVPYIFIAVLQVPAYRSLR